MKKFRILEHTHDDGHKSYSIEEFGTFFWGTPKNWVMASPLSGTRHYKSLEEAQEVIYKFLELPKQRTREVWSN